MKEEGGGACDGDTDNNDDGGDANDYNMIVMLLAMRMRTRRAS